MCDWPISQKITYYTYQDIIVIDYKDLSNVGELKFGMIYKVPKQIFCALYDMFKGNCLTQRPFILVTL